MEFIAVLIINEWMISEMLPHVKYRFTHYKSQRTCTCFLANAASADHSVSVVSVLIPQQLPPPAGLPSSCPFHL